MGEQVKMMGREGQREANVMKIFHLLKKRELIMIPDKKTRLNGTEIRMLSEILSARCEGKRLISTQLADLLGVTRSAVSQIVNRLEEQGVVRRVADDVDRKIAYIEVCDSALGAYGKDIEEALDFVNGLVEEFGQEKFDRMYALFNEFISQAEEQIKARKDRK